MTGRSNLTLIKDRMIFTAIYVDRESVLEGGLVAQYSAASISGAVMRCGVYNLGTANGASWDLGELVYDFGTVAADTAGHKEFTLGTGLTLSAGWYAVQPYSTGSSADIRFGGPTSYMLESNVSGEIENGLSQAWPANPVGIVATTNSYAYNIFIPKWAIWG